MYLTSTFYMYNGNQLRIDDRKWPPHVQYCSTRDKSVTANLFHTNLGTGIKLWNARVVATLDNFLFQAVMQLMKPIWVAQEGQPIFSIDVHPDGSRFATGGQGIDSGRIVIWNMAPILKSENKENVPKLLCQMDHHLACVNCVRWSNSGTILASCGDDKLVSRKFNRERLSQNFRMHNNNFTTFY